jgi:hypothetical protein
MRTRILFSSGNHTTAFLRLSKPPTPNLRDALCRHPSSTLPLTTNTIASPPPFPPCTERSRKWTHEVVEEDEDEECVDSLLVHLLSCDTEDDLHRTFTLLLLNMRPRGVEEAEGGSMWSSA